jgi:hypothetical protein
LCDLETRLAFHPSSIGLFEVTQENLNNVLTWLADAHRRGHQRVQIALLDLERASESHAGESTIDARQLMVDALREAGATDVIESPRQSHVILDLARRHARRTESSSLNDAANQSIADLAWSSLPWQDG